MDEGPGAPHDLGIRISLLPLVSTVPRGKEGKAPVDLAMPGDANGGKDAKNIVNRYVPTGGVQIEQSARARKEHWKAIADAVAKVYASKL